MTAEKVHFEGLLGKKLGMTQVFTDEGECVPVTVLQVGPCYVLDVCSPESHGYAAVRVGFEEKKAQRVNRPAMGNFARAGKGAFYHVNEIRCDAEKLGWTNLGQELKVADVFSSSDFVDVTGTTIGKGFTGVVKRYRVAGQPATRGTHEYRRNIGSIGCRKTPGRVFKNRRMPGRYGSTRVTVQNLKVIGVRPEENLLLVKGAVPGSKGGLVLVRRAVKKEVPAVERAA